MKIRIFIILLACLLLFISAFAYYSKVNLKEEGKTTGQLNQNQQNVEVQNLNISKTDLALDDCSNRIKNTGWNIEYCDTDTIFVNRRPIHACHVVQECDTPWSLAEKYYGDGSQWKKIEVYYKSTRSNSPEVFEDPYTKLEPGTKLIIWKAWEVGGSKNEEAGWGIDSENGDIYTTPSIMDNLPLAIYVNGKIYDGPFNALQFFTIDKRTNNKIYVASTRSGDDGQCYVNNTGRSGGKQELGPGFQIIFNKERNIYFSCGSDYKLLTFSPDGKHYAIRTSTDQDSNEIKFLALSNIGNGPYYDFLDSLIWYNNDTLVYRAQNNDEWRVVVNHKDYKVFNYLENLRLDGGVIKFDARHDDGSWSKEEIIL